MTQNLNKEPKAHLRGWSSRGHLHKDSFTRNRLNKIIIFCTQLRGFSIKFLISEFVLLPLPKAAIEFLVEYADRFRYPKILFRALIWPNATVFSSLRSSPSFEGTLLRISYSSKYNNRNSPKLIFGHIQEIFSGMKAVLRLGREVLYSDIVAFSYDQIMYLR